MTSTLNMMVPILRGKLLAQYVLNVQEIVC